MIARTKGRLVIARAAERAVAAQKNLGRFAQSRVEMMRGYAEGNGCRRAFLLNYFGEAFEPPCNACDACLRGEVEPVIAEEPRPFPLSSAVVHVQWGEGQVMRYEGETMVVLFATVGYRTLDIATVLERGLLAPLAERSAVAAD